MGLELETFFDSSTECLDAFIYFIDDWAYLANNITTRANIEDPLLNFTAIISGNMSEATFECYKFGISVKEVTIERVTAFDSPADWLLAFLFN